MNKKVSTILTLSLMLGGSLLSSSAFAKDIQFPLGSSVDKVANNDIVVFSQAFGTDKYVLGFTKTGTQITPSVIKVGTDEVEEAKLDNYKWKVLVSKTDVQTTPLYTFVNVATGDTLAFQGTSLWTGYAKGAAATYAKDQKYSFRWTANGAEYSGTQAESGAWRFFSEKDATEATPVYNAIELHYANKTANLISRNDLSNATILAKIAETVSTDEDLNALFNTKGFNLDAASLLGDDVAVQGNLFKGDTRIWAFEINDKSIRDPKRIARDEDEKAIGYNVSAKGANGADLVIPNGLYFFTERVLEDDADLTDLKAEDIDWEASKLIAVSPTVTVENTVNDRDKGQGFELIEATLGDFIFKNNPSEFVVGEMPIDNACFTAMYNNAGAYALRLNNFYYQKNSGDKEGTALTPTAADLVVLKFTDNTQYLTTAAAGNAYDYIFTLSDSAVKNGLDLLNTEKKAAVYNIKFISGNDADEELFGKYLTVGVDTNTDGKENTDDDEVAKDTDNFTWVAKGSDIAKLNHPAFQYTITSVAKEAGKENDKDAKYVNVTFTNRETNENFTVKLFPEEGGDNYYSLSFKDNKPISVVPVDVKRNSYGVEISDIARSINENVIIQLIPSEVDEFAGFLNVDDGTVRTIRFARDKFDTSYKWYAGVTTDNNDKYILKNGTYDYFVEDVYDAAQFQLIKSEKPQTIERTYVYNAGTGSANAVANGDKVSAYVYQLQYINDGTETGYYLADNGTAVLEDNEKSEETKFFIKENADGSVSLFRTNGAFENVPGVAGARVTIPTKNVSVDAKVNTANGVVSYLGSTGGEKRSAIYAYISSDMNLKLYLDGEAPKTSWEGEGHVTLQNNTAIAGDYITINDDNEGILLEDASQSFYLHETDKDDVVPSFYISLGKGEGSNAESERMFLFNPVDSVSYPVNMNYDPNYQLSTNDTKAIFKSGALDASRDTLTTSIKGEVRELAEKSNNEGVWAGLNRFKFQIVETEDGDGLYNVRQSDGSIGRDEDNKKLPILTHKTVYLASSGQKLYFTPEKAYALALHIEGVEAPTANEGVSATDVKVVAYDGAINIKNAAGKNVVVSTILGQIVANEVLTSDNATISVPAGIAIVSVDGEEAVKVSVR